MSEEIFRLELTPPELKLTYAALRSLLNDFGHDERDVHDVIKSVLAKLPDAATIAAIQLPPASRRPVA